MIFKKHDVFIGYAKLATKSIYNWYYTHTLVSWEITKIRNEWVMKTSSGYTVYRYVSQWEITM